MALRTIRVEGDEVLTKVSRPVDKMTPRIHDLITDMLDTMYDAMVLASLHRRWEFSSVSL